VPPTLNGGAPFSLCGSSAATTPQPVTQVTIGENFAGSLKTQATITGTGTPDGASSIAATQGTRVALTFNNLNANVNYYVPSSVTNLTTGLKLVAYSAATGSTAATAVTAGSGSGALASQILLTVTNGSATIYYGVNTSDGGTASSVVVPLTETIASSSAVTTPLTATVTASAYLVGVATGYPQYVPVSSPAVFSEPTAQITTSNSLLTSCSTTLLFPYLTNQAGFDTGIAIANASTGLGGPTSAGSCTVTFYGANAPTAAYNTGIIATGTIGTIVVSTVAPNFSGYAVASCNFIQAHADAFIGQFGAGGSLSGNYLAVVTAAANGLPAVSF